MGKWFNGARVRKREIDGKDTRIAALAARAERDELKECLEAIKNILGLEEEND